MDAICEMSNHSEKIEKKIKIFEQAVDIERLKFETKKIEKIFLAIDAHVEASEINENAIQITLNFAKRFQTEVYIACITPSLEELAISEKLVDEAQKIFQLENIVAIGSCASGRPSEHILRLSEEYNPSLMIMPIPYGERTEAFEIETLGSTVDLVIRKSPFPILFIRKPIFTPNEIVKSILLLVDSIGTRKAAEWTLTLANKYSIIKLFSVIEKETLEKVEEIAEKYLDTEIENDVMELIHKKEIQGIINGIVFEAEKKNIKVNRVHLVGDRIKLILDEIKKKHTIIIGATKSSPNNVLETEVENLIRFSQIPILIIKA